MWFEGQTDHKCCGGEEVLVLEKGKRESGVPREMNKENTSPKPVAGKMRRADFCECLQPVGLKDWSCRGWQVWLG